MNKNPYSVTQEQRQSQHREKMRLICTCERPLQLCYAGGRDSSRDQSRQELRDSLQSMMVAAGCTVKL
ncbi:hypothetical protein XELAEV_18021642mg [Xenopus laevis]|uniref:Uncharacterized protein n=1 Tax=Xenopus laevis TaxID=8355 RepID=A0A974D9E7_XENLA|nr:hypothetical protein XELAEV_18021642mg [Xenopus laevis]